MNGLINNILLLLFLLSLCCCQKEKEDANVITFDVGFEDLKNFQGVCHNNGEEEVYFYRTGFKPLVKFYDLEGNLKDTLSLQEIEKKIGRVVLFSTICRDTMFVTSTKPKRLSAFRRDGSFIFTINIDSLCALTEENKYSFGGNYVPQPFYIGGNVVFSLIWNGKWDKSYRTSPDFDYHYILRERMHSPLLCKVEGIYSGSPQMKYALRGYYYKRSPELIAYGLAEKRYAFLNNRLFLALAFDRNVYELDVNTLNVIDTIPVVSQEYEIPLGIKVTDEPGVLWDDIAEQELLKDKCRITNMLYSQSKNQYYIFLKTGKDHSAVDELGYPFKVYIYDDQFVKKGEHSFDNDLYNPKTAMMTSKGIMIEKTIKDQPYGKKTFEFIDL